MDNKTFTHVKLKEPIRESKATTFADGSRLYATPDGKKYPSVTTVLQEYNKKELIEWRNRVGETEANRISSKAAKRGTRLHGTIEQYMQNGPVNVIDPIQMSLFSSIKPYLHRIDNIHLQEKALFSDHLRLAGTVDCIAEYDGRLSVIDFKTSTRNKDRSQIANYFMQCSAYCVMYEEMTGIPVDKIVVLIAVEDGGTQEFIDSRNNHIRGLIHYRDLYEKNHRKENTRANYVLSKVPVS